MGCRGAIRSDMGKILTTSLARQLGQEAVPRASASCRMFGQQDWEIGDAVLLSMRWLPLLICGLRAKLARGEGRNNAVVHPTFASAIGPGDFTHVISCPREVSSEFSTPPFKATVAIRAPTPEIRQDEPQPEAQARPADDHPPLGNEIV